MLSCHLQEDLPADAHEAFKLVQALAARARGGTQSQGSAPDPAQPAAASAAMAGAPPASTPAGVAASPAAAVGTVSCYLTSVEFL